MPPRRVTVALGAGLILVACGDPAAPSGQPPSTEFAATTTSASAAPAGTTAPVLMGKAVTAGAGAATAGAPAARDAPFSLTEQCDLTTITAVAARHPEVGQLIVAQTAGFGATTGTVEIAVRTAGGWRCQLGPRTARFGRNGTRPLVQRRSGDGTTPAGVFPLGTVTAWDGQVFSMFGNRPDPGVLAPYRAVQSQDCWGATPNTARYQHLVNKPSCPGPDDEYLARIGDVYAHAAVIGANLDPISGDAPGETPYAAAIFLHRHDYVGSGTSSGPTEPTSGCVSLAYDDLVAALQLIDPARNPHFAIGPTDYLRGEA